MDKKFFIQAFKYGIVGVGNTLLTLGVIWLMREVLHASLVVANAMGYAVGFLNSFVLNRSWTFQSKENWKVGFVKFFAAFLVCYLIQLGAVLLLEKHTTLPEMYTTLIGVVIYTGTNFILNKFFTFKK